MIWSYMQKILTISHTQKLLELINEFSKSECASRRCQQSCKATAWGGYLGTCLSWDPWAWWGQAMPSSLDYSRVTELHTVKAVCPWGDFSQLSFLFPISSRSCTWGRSRTWGRSCTCGRSCMPQGYSVSSPALSLAFFLLFLSPWWRPVWKHWEVGGCWLLLWLHLFGILIYHISSHTIIKCCYEFSW